MDQLPTVTTSQIDTSLRSNAEGSSELGPSDSHNERWSLGETDENPMGCDDDEGYPGPTRSYHKVQEQAIWQKTSMLIGSRIPWVGDSQHNFFKDTDWDALVKDDAAEVGTRVCLVMK
ncbi:hypothetical protein I302_100914 [Kwoniella bestiolae CBS 10118]|uniref:Uncharacterized protein n=1 Tax=Kwoniella bestiolae CBS 10118 TaxID=1296100 RepID=A0A1B9G6D5_9TREE|nr:hypothetical protein I302_04290 [Kwoniella bestiolae CBS 10118]OCF26604.1 hypothetical protein I302_04290 [Kwoniella bestiolae CBS 10118]